ncbi:hypothetical protein R1flu_027620 [Riccia fluitans]|uniref:NAD-dependent epimerase/dehydratase domain-containing protein n=1 Tax=Riccia fluitans TaxID=41844 RepID=A0ABD1XJC6_9MARC
MTSKDLEEWTTRVYRAHRNKLSSGLFCSMSSTPLILLLLTSTLANGVEAWQFNVMHIELPVHFKGVNKTCYHIHLRSGVQQECERRTMEVCVTGGTGYIASCLIHKLLEKGYKVRSTVRSTNLSQPRNSLVISTGAHYSSQGETNRLRVLKDFPGAKERLTILRADLMDEGSYDDAMEGV